MKNKVVPKSPGRPKGVPNRTTGLLKDAILRAASEAGDDIGGNGLVSYLKAQAVNCPGPFLGLLGKIIPLQVTGGDGNPIEMVTRVELVAPGIDGNGAD